PGRKRGTGLPRLGHAQHPRSFAAGTSFSCRLTRRSSDARHTGRAANSYVPASAAQTACSKTLSTGANDSGPSFGLWRKLIETVADRLPFAVDAANWVYPNRLPVWP